MSPQRQALFWLIFVAVLGLMTFALRDMRLPFVVGVAVKGEATNGPQVTAILALVASIVAVKLTSAT